MNEFDLKKITKNFDHFFGDALFLNRLIGKAIDLLIAIASASILYPAGPLGAFLYILISDGLSGGQSIGKKVVKIKVINTLTKQDASFKDSILRNSPIAVVLLFWLIPIWGWILWFLIGLPILALEIYLMKSLDNQSRLGDTMADTKVVEQKV